MTTIPSVLPSSTNENIVINKSLILEFFFRKVCKLKAMILNNDSTANIIVIIRFISTRGEEVKEKY